MKKLLLLIIPLFLLACSDDEPKFRYDINLLYGAWDVTHVQDENGYINLTYNLPKTYISFTNGYYWWYGGWYFEYLDAKVQPYKIVDNTIICYDGSKVFFKFDILSLDNEYCELMMYVGNSTTGIKVKCKKDLGVEA
jgi:hypothetical protein